MTASPPRPWILRALVITQIAVAILLAMDWAYLPTFHLFLDHRIAAKASTAAQRFDIEGAVVVPLIVTRGPDRVAFATAVGHDSTIHVDLRSTGPARYAIEWHQGAARRVLAQGSVNGLATVVCAYPDGTGIIDLVSDDALTWVDPRVVRGLALWPYAWMVLLLILSWFAWRARGPERRTAEARRAMRVAVFRGVAAMASLAAALLVSEVALRELGDRAPTGIADERHDLGEVTRDPRWVETARYGRRLRAGVENPSEWRDGDIVRMGFLPPASPPAPLHQYTVRTDAEGFRNRVVRDRFDVAALGDSFTDAMTMPAEASWPARLERRLGAPVQNYGTAGFGPQQELLVLKDFVAPHRPRTVVLAFFAGNDLFEAEAFDTRQRPATPAPRAASGWQVKNVVSRADTWFVTSALRAGSRWLGSRHAGVAEAAATPTSLTEAPVAAPPGASASFDRGRFTVPVAGRLLRWSFMPPYLNTLNFSMGALAARPGWRLTREAIAEMQHVSRAFGGRLVVMFLPFKSQVYLPVLEGAMPRETLRQALSYSLDRYGRDADVERVFMNRLAQNHLMREFCAESGIPFLDMTPALAARVAQGENVYFPDESHLNETGEAVVADALAAFLRGVNR